MAKSNRNAEILNDIIKLLDKVLAHDEWQKSLFLQKSSKELEDYRQEVKDLLDDITGVKHKIIKEVEANEAEALMTVYVSVFQMDPNDMLAWQATLNSIAEYSVTRPIYLNEDHVQELIRSKPDPSREGYVEVTIKKSDIVAAVGGKPQVDKLDHPLVNVRQGTVRPGNIKRFVHRNKVYHFQDGGLHRVDDNTA